MPHVNKYSQQLSSITTRKRKYWKIFLKRSHDADCATIVFSRVSFIMMKSERNSGGPHCEGAKRGQIAIYFDETCPVCIGASRHYSALDETGELEFLPLGESAERLRAAGISEAKARRAMHAVDLAGRTLSGIDALAVIWERIPAYRILARLARTPVISSIMRLSYAVFARLRPRVRTAKEREN